MQLEAYTMIGHHTLVTMEYDSKQRSYDVSRWINACSFKSPQEVMDSKHVEQIVEAQAVKSHAEAFEVFARLSMAEMTEELLNRALEQL